MIHFKLFFVFILCFGHSFAFPVASDDHDNFKNVTFSTSDSEELLLVVPLTTATSVSDLLAASVNKSEHDTATQTDSSQTSSDKEFQQLNTASSLDFSPDLSIVESSSISNLNQMQLEKEESTTPIIALVAFIESSSDPTTEQQEQLLEVSTIEPVLTGEILTSSEIARVDEKTTEETVTRTVIFVGEPSEITTPELAVVSGSSTLSTNSNEPQTESNLPLMPTSSIEPGENPIAGTEQPQSTTTPFLAECKTDVVPSEAGVTLTEVKGDTIDDQVKHTTDAELTEESGEELTGSESVLSQRSTDKQDATEGEQLDASHSEAVTLDTTTVASEEANALPTEVSVNLPVTASIETSHESLIATDSTVPGDIEELAVTDGVISTEPTSAEGTTTPLSVEASPTPNIIAADAVTLTSKQTSPEKAPSFGSNSTHRLSSASILRTHSSAAGNNVSFLVALFVLMANFFVINI